jgi:hypothetical protein
MTTATTTTGVATLKQLNKECLTIDLEKVDIGKGLWKPSNNIFSTNAEGENPFIKFGGNGSPDGIFNTMFAEHPSQKWEYEWSDKSPEGYWRNLKILKFQGGKQGRRRFIHNSFTDTQILIHDITDEILGVLYALDNDYLNEWLRETIDPNIRNNWDELHAQKEFEVLITTTTYTTEKVKVVGRSYDDARENLRKTDPTLDVGGCFSGMKTTSTETEWMSLQEKEVA